MTTPAVNLPAAPADPNKVIREVLQISAGSQGFVQAYGQGLLAILGPKLNSVDIMRLSDPPAANANDPDVLAFQAYCTALIRGDRLVTTWKGLMAGNAAFYATPPDFEKSGGGGDHPSPGGGGGVSGTAR